MPSIDIQRVGALNAMQAPVVPAQANPPARHLRWQVVNHPPPALLVRQLRQPAFPQHRQEARPANG